MLTLTDTHCHLSFRNFVDDRDEVIKRAFDCGIKRILDIGIDLKTSKSAVMTSSAFSQVYAAVGVHPNSALSWNSQSYRKLQKLAKNKKVSAIGEIGLDYYRDRAPQEIQRKVFKLQLKLASENELPVIIHSRNAIEDVLDILDNWYTGVCSNKSPLVNNPGVLHSFSGNIESGLKAVNNNFYLGFSGPVTFKNAKELRRVVEWVDIKKMLIETDSPFLTPHPNRGRRNEPSYVRLIAEKIALTKNVTVESVADSTYKNSCNLFNW